jgi:hypothetical protein
VIDQIRERVNHTIQRIAKKITLSRRKGFHWPTLLNQEIRSQSRGKALDTLDDLLGLWFLITVLESYGVANKIDEGVHGVHNSWF